MIVTKIERQRRNPRRYSIELDGEFAFGVDEEVLASAGLRKGDSLDESARSRLLSSEEFTHAKQTALRFIGRRFRTEREVRLKLTEKEFLPEITDRVIEYLRALQLLDDERFARAFIHDSQLRRPAGPRLLRQRLLLKGVPRPIVDELLASGRDEPADRERAMKLARTAASGRGRKKPGADNMGAERRRIGLLLARRGFEWSVITPILNTLFRARE